MEKPKAIAVIPARFASSRIPGKPLKLVRGKTLVQRVYEQIEKSVLIDKLLVATDDRRVLDVVLDFGGEAVLTSKGHKTGTDRIAEVASRLKCDLVINVQCDQPFLDPKIIDQLISYMLRNRRIYAATLARKISQRKSLLDPNIVKVVMDKDGFALYFSRLPLPFSWGKAQAYHQHIGIYGFRKSFLMKLARLKQTPLEKTEKLEQLRILENGYKIKILISEYKSSSIDCPVQLERLNREFSLKKENN